ncbi:MAG: hypothetical protein HUU15_14720 [Candidatus Brocadiae bacterium]|nr:hypothetical protein [Candidatus Brocadiia bacterium]
MATEILKRLDAGSAAAAEHPAERGNARWGALARLLASGVVRYPPTGLLVLALAGYVLIVGPGCLLMLRRRHRPALAVVLIPLLGVAATAVLLIAGSLVSERVTLGNRLTVLQPIEGSEEARALETVILLSPRRRISPVDSGEGRVRTLADGRRHGIVDARMGGPDGDRLLWGFETREPAWFAAQGRRRLGPLRVYRRDGTLVVENGTEFALESARLVEGGRLLLGNIPAGSTFERELPPTLPRFWEREPLPEPGRPGYLEEITSRVLDEAGESFREASRTMFVARVAFPSPEFRVDDRPQAFGLDFAVVIVPVEVERR